MIKFFLSVVVLYSSLIASSKQELYESYQAGNYLEVCKKGKAFYSSGSNDEKLLSLIGNACLKVDYINPLGDIIKKLVSTLQFRENASYFATILLQKKLIYQFMNDGIDLKNLRLPRTAHLLSVVFENLVKKNYKKVGDKLIIDTENKKYILWNSNDIPKKVFIEEYKDGKLLKRHWYL